MWWLVFLCAAAFIFLIYCFIPSYWARNCSTKVLRMGKNEKPCVALTFDDGPSSLYTYRLLNILKEFKIPATFFLVGKEASSHPELVKRMKEEGHLIGCHSFSHHHAWLMDPLTTYKDMNNSYKAIKDILGEPPRWYRPPWGTFNLFTASAAKRLGLHPAYWCIEAQDWDARTSVEHIYETVFNQLKPGAIIVLHDNGGAPGAPEKTLKALPIILKTLLDKGYHFVTLDEMKGADHD